MFLERGVEYFMRANKQLAPNEKAPSVIGWADVLWLPVFYAYSAWFFGLDAALWLVLAAMGASYLVFVIFKDKLPFSGKDTKGNTLVTFMAAVFVSWLLLNVVGLV